MTLNLMIDISDLLFRPSGAQEGKGGEQISRALPCFRVYQVSDLKEMLF